MSHTVTVKIEFRDPAVLRLAVESLGGQWLGHRTNRLYDGTLVTGNCFTLPRWQYPLTIQANGILAYDDYNGAWGNVADLDKLKTRYAIEAARAEATNQGWYSEDQADGSLLIFHPDGGTLLVTTVGIDASGFTGSSCSAASEPIARAIGQSTGETQKEAFNQRQQVIRES